MALASDVKKQIMAEYATAEGDTGSPEVQVAMLTRRIADLTEHLQHAQARPPQPPGSAAAGRPPPPAAEVPGEDRHHPLPVADRATRPAPVAPRGEWPPGRSPSSYGDPPYGTKAPCRSARRENGRRSSVVAPGSTNAPGASIEDRLAGFPPRRASGPDVARKRAHEKCQKARFTSPLPPSTTASFGTRSITLRDRPAGQAGRRLRRRAPRRRPCCCRPPRPSQAPEGALRLLPADRRRRGADVRRRPDPRLVLPPRGPPERGRDPHLPADRPPAAPDVRQGPAQRGPGRHHGPVAATPTTSTTCVAINARVDVHPAVRPAVLRPDRRHPGGAHRRPVGRLPDPRRARGRRPSTWSWPAGSCPTATSRS